MCEASKRYPNPVLSRYTYYYGSACTHSEHALIYDPCVDTATRA